MGRVPSPLAAMTPILQSSTRASTCQSPHLQLLASARPQGQFRHATFIHRPRRPYTFTQLIQLSDGSTYTHRTTSPQPLYRATKDTRNTLLWQPSERSLRNREEDEAGKLAAFRQRFGRAYDSAAATGEEAEKATSDKTADGENKAAANVEEEQDDFSSLISSYAVEDKGSMKDAAGSSAAKTKRK